MRQEKIGNIIQSGGNEKRPVKRPDVSAFACCHAARPPLLLLGVPRYAQASFPLASSVSWVKAALSLTASSASILRLISTLASFSPCMKVE